MSAELDAWVGRSIGYTKDDVHTSGVVEGWQWSGSVIEEEGVKYRGVQFQIKRDDGVSVWTVAYAYRPKDADPGRT